MSIKDKTRHILVELKAHAPFTLFGAVIGLVFMLFFRNIGEQKAHVLFTIFHPTHVVLSAMVTASLFSLHKSKKSFLLILLVGYFGSIGIATLSDSIIPYFGEYILGLHIPSHGQSHGHEGIYIGFIEDWYIVTPAAILGVTIAFFIPRTRFPHAIHVLISTWASSSYILMNAHSQITAAILAGLFVTLFIATWVPCCISDIVFPLLFVKPDMEGKCKGPHRCFHSHPHNIKPDTKQDD